LTISNVTTDSIEFELFAASGGSTGECEGKAAIKDNVATYSFKEETETCIIEFKLFGDSIIEVNQKEGECFTGLGVYYSGKYLNSKLLSKKETKKEDKNLIELTVLQNSKQDSVFRSLVGSYYDLFVNTTQLISEGDDLDSMGARVVSSGVRGLYTQMENIVMVDSSNNIWAAVLDDEKVIYFTNSKQYTDSLPKTINNWRESFQDYKIIYKSK